MLMETCAYNHLPITYDFHIHKGCPLCYLEIKLMEVYEQELDRLWSANNDLEDERDDLENQLRDLKNRLRDLEALGSRHIYK